MKSKSTELETILDTFRENIEDMWDQFMEGDSPDPQKYDEIIDNAFTQAKTEILEWALSKLPHRMESVTANFFEPRHREATNDALTIGYNLALRDMENRLREELQE